MDYNATIELEENIKIKNKANELYDLFLKNINLNVKNYEGNGKFLHWSDSHNATYFVLKDNIFYYECDFLHESYKVCVTPESLFNYIKNKYRGVDHFDSAVRYPRNT